ncbi:Peptidoglycan-associated lipoprotein [Flavobacterium bizetiae]|uniref:Peptidoglycan-associated lipoprotein n=1 Tax=Flavobacterium bizetiae TaxID=2704140 RepID=A0A6N3IXB1_9FLAO|nr:OmpA family protein [Flavobacterium bizetiae]CAA9199692.1 Peptidoglycan-associated lipoprotein [Flavobacterium bizetiae]CAD5341418.1 Peptidoglycan-associated lipoprotein [Flavobacterium bizetiae]CAD5346149.1 Peptidoglycan-associated lipoprotein [Flavobacterium bizetiae]
MKIKHIVSTLFLALIALKGNAQTANQNKADKDYTQYAYIDAIGTYEKVAEKGYKDETMFQRLGNAYYFNGELMKAAKWYEALFEMNAEQEPEYYYRYSQTLKANGDYAKADKILEAFNKKTATDKRGILFENNKNYLEQIKANSGRFKIANAGINSKQTDYGSAYYNNKIVFASARDTGGVVRKTFKWTNKAFTNLYSAELKTDGTLGEPERFEKKINSKFNESTPVFTKDGKTMYFTRNNYLKGKRGRDDQKITLLKLYRAEFVNDKWTNITELPFNSDQYSTAHPALSNDEKKLYFASDMPGTLGQSDLYSVTINDDKSFGKPENLGQAINTEGRETFPFIAADNQLYFASDGRPGLGGLDVFVTTIKSDNTFTAVQNVGAPVNSKQDDFAFIINSESSKGFFSSNREGGIGNDDIYKLTETRKLLCEQKLKATIVDLETSKVLENAKVTLLDEQFKVIAEVLSQADGTYTFNVECNKKYYVRAAKEDFETKEVPVTIIGEEGETSVVVALEKRIKPIGVGTDLAKTLNIPIIYFDLDKSFIRKDAAFELEKILAVMKQYPKMKIDVRSHTDSRQTAEYNIALSNRRAKATIQWLTKNGIASNRLTGKGYGESQLLNKCSDGVSCTEAEHQLNRRSEFIIVSIE